MLLYASAPSAINATLYDKLSFNFISDIAPVASVQRVPLILVANPSLPPRTGPELIAYAKSIPGKISFGSPGIGTTSHLAGELFKFMSGVDMVHVPYRGGGALLGDLLSGQIQVTFVAMAAVAGYIRTGKLRALAVTGATRLETLPDIPAVGEFVAGYEAVAWEGLGAPKNTPLSIINNINEEVNVWLADPKTKAQLADLGGVAMPMSPADFGKFIATETEKWGKVIRTANIKPE
jgi:tripartite-type tricarboxylate transporter receptor subunit TctC